MKLIAQASGSYEEGIPAVAAELVFDDGFNPWSGWDPNEEAEDRAALRKQFSEFMGEIFADFVHVFFDDECSSCLKKLGPEKKCHTKDCCESEGFNP